MNDPQMGIVRILRPYKGFEAVYDAQPANTPIMFTEGGMPLDQNAGNTGYSPYLLKGLPVVQGQRVSIWLPAIVANDLIGTIIPYSYLFIWRYRNVYDFRNDEARPPFSFPFQDQGIADTTAIIGGPRVIIPAANQSIVFSEAEVVTIGGRAVINVRANDASPRQGNIPFVLPPLILDSAGVTKNAVTQQGLFDPNVDATTANPPLYNTYDLVALGDELLIGVYRAVSSIANWEFTTVPTADKIFSDLFGNGLGKTYPDIGIYVTVGKAP